MPPWPVVLNIMQSWYAAAADVVAARVQDAQPCSIMAVLLAADLLQMHTSCLVLASATVPVPAPQIHAVTITA